MEKERIKNPSAGRQGFPKNPLVTGGGVGVRSEQFYSQSLKIFSLNSVYLAFFVTLTVFDYLAS
jgi:hypothetical protein